jgi:acetyl esterase/lipase
MLMVASLALQRLFAQPLGATPSPPALPLRPVFNLPYASAGPGTPGSIVDEQRTLDLYLPTGSATGSAPASAPAAAAAAAQPKPAPSLFIYIHGGAWISGDKSQYRPLGFALAAQGVAVAIINYRLSGDGTESVLHPAHAQDAAAAVAWLRKHAAEYGYDANRVFLGGHSAGAHMTALLAYDAGLLAAAGEKPDSLRGFIGIEGIYDLNQLVHRFPSYRVDFLQLAFGSDEALWRSASPQNLVGSAAPRRPWLLIHSREDELVDLEQSQKFRQVLEKQSISVRWLSPEHDSHFGVISELATPTSPLCQQLLAFLRS